MWFKKNIIIPKYKYNENVPFEVAFKALKEGYIIKHSNYDDCFLKYLNGRVYEMMDRDGENCFEIQEFSIFEKMMDLWQVLEPNSIRSKK